MRTELLVPPHLRLIFGILRLVVANEFAQRIIGIENIPNAEKPKILPFQLLRLIT